MAGYEALTDEMLVVAVKLVALGGHAAWDEYLAAGGEKAPLPVKERMWAVLFSSMAELHALEREVRRRGGLPVRPD